MEANFCRRCGSALKHKAGNAYGCSQGHTIFRSTVPANAIIFVRGKQVMFSVRGIEPGKGKIDLPGGFCDDEETFEASVVRELKEELGLNIGDYETPRYITSLVSDYLYQGETVKPLVAYFWSRLKPHAKVVPQDDVAKVMFLDYDHPSLKTKLNWPEHLGVLEQLHKQGVFKGV